MLKSEGPDLKRRLELHRTEFARVKSVPFEHFYCPILGEDIDTPLCLGHVINEGFEKAPRRRVVQRRDVDNFFGAYFEADFLLVQERGKHTAADTISERHLARQFRPTILIDGQEVEHYIPTGSVPPTHTEVAIDRGHAAPGRIALKLTPSDVLQAKGRKWEFRTARDVRLPALVSLLKAAHLTLFDLHGYQYVFTGGGHFLGRTILGTFVAAHLGKPKAEVSERAHDHFAQYERLVRPMVAHSPELKGTLTDRQVLVCWSSRGPWGVMVFLRAGDTMHAVIVPVFQQEDSALDFNSFLDGSWERFEARPGLIHPDRWEIATSGREITWPEGRFEDPIDPHAA
jgi:hypothetical protein